MRTLRNIRDRFLRTRKRDARPGARTSAHEPRQLSFDLDIPNANPGRPSTPRARRGSRSTRTRLLLTIVATSIATAGILTGSYATWSIQTNNPSNSVSATTISLGNDKSGSSVFAATNVAPGDTGSSTVQVTNSSPTLPLSVTLTQDSVTATGIESSLRLKIHDDTRNWCYWPATGSGACATYGNWDATGTVNSLAIPATSGAAQWPTSEAHTFTVSWQLLGSSPNSDQGKTGSFRLVWNGAQ